MKLINYAVNYLESTEDEPIIAHYYSPALKSHFPIEYASEEELRNDDPNIIIISVTDEQDDILRNLFDSVHERLHGAAWISWFNTTIRHISENGIEEELGL